MRVNPHQVKEAVRRELPPEYGIGILGDPVLGQLSVAATYLASADAPENHHWIQFTVPADTPTDAIVARICLECP